MSLFVHSLTALDASYWCAERGLVGASWQVDVELDGELGEDGMLFDFGEVKPWAKRQIDATLDHTLIVPTQMPGLSVSECAEGLCVRTQLPWPMEVRAPRQAFTLLPWSTIEPQRLGRYLGEQLGKRPPPRVGEVRVQLREEPIAPGFGYTYSHGLKRHAGNCQRIAHGHRSRLGIWRDGELDEALIQRWCARLADIYLADRADLVGSEEDESLRFAYESAQGQFRIRLPRERVVLMPFATTVEQIAHWLAEETALAHGGRIRVQAFEGIGKGATAEAKR
ncbi:6-pyruvoyl trahydropterin synthase family protein [Halotalea alkalilenta]|uniref:6-pyruvoyl trahydropterin synthase family protein n=1 Tax=Halotalea alkalilenta TaxID=376489 RepID=UPI0004833684|nr:6-carboxytetrahydropterin synthase [Halotalea alkalilenta]